MQERTDEELMQAYAKGNLDAFELLYNRHRGALYRYMLRQVGEAATANDLYQGCWEKIIKARTGYRPAAPFRAWMYRIARNHIMDHFRRSKPESDVTMDDLESTDPGPQAQFLENDRNTRLKHAVATLPAPQREAILLKLEGGFDIPAIAEITGVNRETAKSRLRYAVDRLKAILQE